MHGPQSRPSCRLYMIDFIHLALMNGPHCKISGDTEVFHSSLEGEIEIRFCFFIDNCHRDVG